MKVARPSDGRAAGRGLERQAGLQVRERRVDLLEHVVRAVVGRDQRDRHDHADDGAGHVTRGGVTGLASGAAGYGLAHHLDSAGEFVHGPGPDLGH